MDDPALGHLLGTGKVAEVFACGNHAAKLYRSPSAKRSAFREGAALAVAHALGLPVPAVWAVRSFGDRWAVVMDRVDGRALAEVALSDVAGMPTCLAAMARLHVQVHAQPGTHFPSLKARLRANIEAAAMLGPARQKRLLKGLAALPDGDRLCHGDFHPWNIIGTAGQEVIVDWLDAASGEPAADVCRSYVLIAPRVPDLASAYVDVYAAGGGIGRSAILRWLPFVAAARLAEDVPDETDVLMAMVDAR